MIDDRKKLEQIRNECRSMVTKRSLASAAVAAVPVPGVDVAADAALVMELLPRITRRFGLSQEQLAEIDPGHRREIMKMATAAGNMLIGRVVTEKIAVSLLKKAGIRLATKSIVKYVPLVGTAVATTLSFSAMRWLGNAHIDDCFTVASGLIDTVEPAAA